MNQKDAGAQPVSTVLGPKTGIFMEIFTREPGLQFYSGNFLKGKSTGKTSSVYRFSEKE